MRYRYEDFNLPIDRDPQKQDHDWPVSRYLLYLRDFPRWCPWVNHVALEHDRNPGKSPSATFQILQRFNFFHVFRLFTPRADTVSIGSLDNKRKNMSARDGTSISSLVC